MFIKIAQLFLSLTILVTLHEFGHFWFARRFKCRVDKFYLFFDFLFPFSGVLNFPLFKKKIGDTEYGLGWFPFGGYVQIAGMMDEQMDKSLIDKEPEPWELRAKPAWQRLLVMLGGILVNVIVGILIFWMSLFAWGKETLPMANVKTGLMVDSNAYKIGLRNGDFITSLDRMPVKSINRVAVEIIMNGIDTIEGVHANGEKFSLRVTDDDRSRILKALKHSEFIRPRYVATIDSVPAGTSASRAQIKKGDVFLAINGTPVKYFDEFRQQLMANKNNIVPIKILRGKDTVNTRCYINGNGVMGVVTTFLELPAKTDKQEFGFFEALVQGVKDGKEMLVMQAKQIVVLITVKDAHQQVSGFYTMVQQMHETWDWQRFWVFTAFLSLALAFMNFLPIPMLDGGYIMFILWEMVTGKKVSDKIIYYANNVGLIIVLSLMIYANTDWLRQ